MGHYMHPFKLIGNPTISGHNHERSDGRASARHNAAQASGFITADGGDWADVGAAALMPGQFAV
jgi:hypothetical protein